MSVRLFSLAPLLALGLWAITTTTATVTQVPATGCTDGVNCYCDTIASDPDLLFCEDFEQASLDDGTGDGWTAKYGGGTCDSYGGRTCCLDAALWNTLEGPYGNSCLNIVTEGACDAQGGDPGNDCVLQGNRSLGVIYNPGKTGGFMGDGTGTTWTRPNGNLSITMAIKFTTNYLNYAGSKGPANKQHQFSSSAGANENQCVLGCATTSEGYTNHYDSNPAASRLEGLAGANAGYPYSTAFGWEGGASHDPFDPPANVIRGYAFWGTAGLGWGPMSDYAPNFTKGQWHCRQVQYTGWGTTNTTVKEWWDEVLVVHIEGWDSTNVNDQNRNFNRFAWNSFFNGANGTDSGYGANSSGVPIPGATRAYQYNDNFVITKKATPETCASIGWTAP